ncbi:MAG: 4-hydroxy-tetrahydrodipicolinate synthase [Alphaproteobacteria bacterium]|nr:4-hydroxy-tetrahydrodipicolinate synthase [Alphaproteobacteria bacterium]
MFRGYIAAVVSPFKGSKVDLYSFEKYIHKLSGTGVFGIVVCGSTGESLALTSDEYISLISKASEVVSGKIKVIAGVISSSTNYCLSLINQAEKYVDGFLCICPYYIKPTQAQLIDHFTRLSRSTEKPIILYNNPGRVGVSIGEKAFRTLSEIENVVAIKECDGDLSRFALWRRDLKEDFDLLTGNDDSAFGALAMGANGVISVSANVCPRLCVKAYEAFVQGNMSEFSKYRDLLAPLHKLMFSEPSPAPVKYALSKLRLMTDEIREPLAIVSEDLKYKIDEYLDRVKEYNAW